VDELDAALNGARIAYLSGITLAILPAQIARGYWIGWRGGIRRMRTSLSSPATSIC
jgi:hypothetical protein